MEELKILIQLLYYERPNLVKNALHSILNLNYSNWHVAAIDDGSSTPLEPIIKEYFPEKLHSKFTFYNTYETVEQKNTQGGASFGRLMNVSMEENNCDLAIMLCDDDAIHQDYFKKLNDFFNMESAIVYGYSWVIPFNPNEFFYADSPIRLDSHLNKNSDYIIPHRAVDASQVAWRIAPVLKEGIQFPYPQTRNLDESFYGQLFAKFGPCKLIGCIGQYKGHFSQQLGSRADDFGATE